MDRNTNGTKTDGATNVNIWLPHHTMYVSPAETDRHRERQHQQLRRRAGQRRRRRDHGHHQVGHQRVQGLGVRVLQQRAAATRGRTSPPRRSRHERAHRRRHARRTDHEEQAVLLRRRGKGSISGRRSSSSSTCRPAALRGGDFSQAFNADGTLQVIYDPLTGNADGTGRAAVPRQRDSGRPHQRHRAGRFRRSIRCRTSPGSSRAATSAARRSSATTCASRPRKFDRNNYDFKVNWNRRRRRRRSGASTRGWAPTVDLAAGLSRLRRQR